MLIPNESFPEFPYHKFRTRVAQLAVQLTRNEQIVGSITISG